MNILFLYFSKFLILLSELNVIFNCDVLWFVDGKKLSDMNFVIGLLSVRLRPKADVLHY